MIRASVFGHLGFTKSPASLHSFLLSFEIQVEPRKPYPPTGHELRGIGFPGGSISSVEVISTRYTNSYINFVTSTSLGVAFRGSVCGG